MRHLQHSVTLISKSLRIRSKQLATVIPKGSKNMISAYSLRITLGRRHRKQHTDRVVEYKGEQLEVNINSSIANGTEISANPVVHEANL